MKPFDSSLVTAAAVVFWLLSTQLGNCYYSPSTGRWLSRDPIGERGEANVFCFVENAPVTAIDVIGLAPRWHGSCLCPLERDVLWKDWDRGCFVTRQAGFDTCLVKKLGAPMASRILDCLSGFCGYAREFTVKCRDKDPLGRPGRSAIGRGSGSTVTIYRDRFYSRQGLDRGYTFIHEFLHLDACGAFLHPRTGVGGVPFDEVADCFLQTAGAHPPPL